MSSSPASSQVFSDRLCPKCRSILQSLPEIAGLGRGTEHYRDFRDLLRSAQSGCYLCYCVAFGWENIDMSDAVEVFSVIGVLKQKDNKSPFAISLTIQRRDHQRRFAYAVLEMNFDVEWVDDGRIPKSSPLELSAGSTTSATSLMTARCWLDRCLASHRSCNPAGAKDQWYPSRLLRLDRSPAGISVRLQECDSEPPTGPYVSLSHRWGGAKFITLRTDNLSSMRVGIPFDDFSKTFQDAMEVTLSLGYNYLWIDSLCIVQDSMEDWLREAALMKHVYEHARFTISAAHPRALEEGLSSTRHHEVVDCVDCDVRVDVDSSEKKRARITQNSRKLFAELVATSPIAKRAWIVQERILSHRILYFAFSQLAWECDEMAACELYPSGIPDPGFTSNNGGLGNEVSRKVLKAIASGPSHGPDGDGALGSAWHLGWLRLLNSYTSCDLTKGSDKLIALSGVARYYQGRLLHYNEYLAGLWRRTFVEELTWRSADPIASCRPKEYRAPSWSWAAIDGAVFNPHITQSTPAYDRIVELIDVRTDLVDPDNETGAVRGGIAILRGKLIEVCWERHPHMPSEALLLLPGSGDEGCESLEKVAYSWPDDDNDIPGKAYCLMLLHRQRLEEYWYWVLDSPGIVMEEVQHPDGSQSLRHFRRVGVFEAVGDGIEKLASRSRESTVAIV